MIRSKKLTYWTSHIEATPFPGKIVHNYSLGKTASSLAVYIPFYTAQKNVNFIAKEEPKKMKGGEDLGLTKPSALLHMEGKGAMTNVELALHQPIKVTGDFFKCYLFILFFSGLAY